jgi:hypothetical protein
VHHRKNVAKSFVKTIPASAVSRTRTVYSTVEHLSDKFNAGQKENTHCVPTKRNVGTQMETSPKKSLYLLSKSSAHMAKELLKVHSYKITAMQRLFPSNEK